MPMSPVARAPPACRSVTTAPDRTYTSRPPDLPVAHMQLALFDLQRDLTLGHRHGFLDPADPMLARLLDQASQEHARRHGWSKTRLVDARRGIRILLSLQDTPGPRSTPARLRYSIRFPLLRNRSWTSWLRSAYFMLIDSLPSSLGSKPKSPGFRIR